MSVGETDQLWGSETRKAVENFPVSGQPIRLEIVHWLGALKAAAARHEVNLMPNLLDCARVHATEGEIVQALQEVFGTYT